MEENQGKEHDVINPFDTQIIPTTGVFEWNDSLKTVIFKKFDSDNKADKFKNKFQDRTTHMKRERNDVEQRKQIQHLVSDMRTKAASTFSGDPSTRPITFLDCKAVALNEMLTNRYPLPDTFMEFFLQTISHSHCAQCHESDFSQQIAGLPRNDYEHVPPFDQLIASLSVYFDYFFKKKDADEGGDGMFVSRSQAEEQMLVELGMKMKDAAKQFGVVYNTMILGIGMDQLHHMNRGKCRVSTTLTDRHMFEALYHFAIEFIWIVFGRRDRDLILREVGRMFRSDSFNTTAGNKTKSQKSSLEEEEIDVTTMNPKEVVWSKDKKPLKDYQILNFIDKRSNKILAARRPSDRVLNANKEATGRGNPKSAHSTSTKLSTAKDRSKSSDIEQPESDEEINPIMQKSTVTLKKRNQLELAKPLTEDQILACIDRVATRYEEAIKVAVKEHQKRRIFMKRPPKKSLMEQRSIAAESIIPSVKPPGGDRAAQKPEEVNPFLKMPKQQENSELGRYLNVRKLTLGIIGQSLINYNANSLIPLVNVSSQQQSNGNAQTGAQVMNETLRYYRSKQAAEAVPVVKPKTPMTRETTMAIDEASLR